MNRNRIAAWLGVLGLTMMCAQPALAGPPFLTDDPQPIDYRHSEAYLFETTDKMGDNTATNLPAIEYNYGPAPNVHLHVVLPYSQYHPVVGSGTAGFGDIEFGVKFRFVQETATRPMIGIFPMAELATGNAAQNLGNGRTWYRLPLWIQKSWGGWTTYGGGGEAINTAPGQRDYPFGGWLIQRSFNDKFTLGGEIFSQGPTTVGAQSSTVYNIGGYWNFSPNFSLLFSNGHSFAGEYHAVNYLALYWTWGPK
jgi:hypothetical protein